MSSPTSGEDNQTLVKHLHFAATTLLLFFFYNYDLLTNGRYYITNLRTKYLTINLPICLPQHHDKNVGERKKALSKLRHTVKKKETKSLTNFSICLCSLSLPSHSLPQHHDKNVGERKKALSKLRHTVKKKEQDNDNLDDQLDEMNVCVAERKHINDVNGKILSIPYSSNSDVQ